MARGFCVRTNLQSRLFLSVLHGLKCSEVPAEQIPKVPTSQNPIVTKLEKRLGLVKLRKT